MRNLLIILVCLSPVISKASGICTYKSVGDCGPSSTKLTCSLSTEKETTRFISDNFQSCKDFAQRAGQLVQVKFVDSSTGDVSRATFFHKYMNRSH